MVLTTLVQYITEIELAQVWPAAPSALRRTIPTRACADLPVGKSLQFCYNRTCPAMLRVVERVQLAPTHPGLGAMKRG